MYVVADFVQSMSKQPLSNLRCGFGLYWRPYGQVDLLACSRSTWSDRVYLALLVSSVVRRFLMPRIPSSGL